MRKRIREKIDLVFPLSAAVTLDVQIEVDFERQVIRFKAPGQTRYQQIALWVVYEMCEKDK